MIVGVMKDYKLKLRNLHASQTQKKNLIYFGHLTFQKCDTVGLSRESRYTRVD